MPVYSLVFLGILIVELLVFGLHYEVETFEFKVFFLLLALITGFALAVFIIEEVLRSRRFQRSLKTEQAKE